TEHAKGADLLLCEASFLDSADNPTDIHLTGSEAGRVAGDAAVGRLLLTHIPPWHRPQDVLAEAQVTYDGDVALADVGRSYDV
ncbi:MAG: MBL fold metallo-hydrolase, partial [Actinomycetota bacterium]|nr:MBL fold metallo-hydrolase [Actinomycetota bacterium]